MLTQYFLRTFKPVFFAFLTRIIYLSSNVSIGKNFKTDTIPKILIDNNCKLLIGDNVEFRRNVEIRVHNSSKIIINNNIRIDRGVRLLSTNKAVINLGDGCRIGLYSVFNGGDSISVGEKALISGFVYLQTSMHNYKTSDKAIQDQGFSHAPIILENDTWLGTHVVVLPGVTIGFKSVVGSNAVVSKSVLPNQVVVGIPAKPIKNK
jgi:acetyltransferase-like isoleucine patch superfamily enzyme